MQHFCAVRVLLTFHIPRPFFLLSSPFFLLALAVLVTCFCGFYTSPADQHQLPAHHLLCESVNLPGSRRGVYFFLFLSNLTDSCHVPWLTVQKATYTLNNVSALRSVYKNKTCPNCFDTQTLDNHGVN